MFKETTKYIEFTAKKYEILNITKLLKYVHLSYYA